MDSSLIGSFPLLPQKERPESFNNGYGANSVVQIYSASLARSHLLLTIQLFRYMTRHLSDRDDLSVNLNGVNLALLHHGKDISIVGLAMLGL